jgi:hypothetical protein
MLRTALNDRSALRRRGALKERVVDRKFDPLTFLGSVIRRRKGD